MRLPYTEQEQIRHSMERMAVMILGKAVVVMLHDPSEIGVSTVINGIPQIGIGLNYNFSEKDIGETEAVSILYGVFTHELLHLLRTDFAYSSDQINLYPREDQMFRQIVMNIVEDPAIEYLRSDRLSKFLNKSLDTAIAYFTRTEGRINAKGSTELSQLLNALIEFGDIGVINGFFTFQEAEDTFYQVVPMMNQAIKSADFKKRFEIGMKIADIIKPFWDKCDKNPGNMVRQKKDFGSNSQTIKGNDASGKGASPSDNAAAKNRDLTIHLIDDEIEKQKQLDQNRKEASTQSDINNASDVYVNTDQANDQAGQSPSDIDLSNRNVKVVDERKKKKENKQDNNGTDQSTEGKTETPGSASSEGNKGFSKQQEAGSQQGSCNENEQSSGDEAGKEKKGGKSEQNQASDQRTEGGSDLSDSNVSNQDANKAVPQNQSSSSNENGAEGDPGNGVKHEISNSPESSGAASDENSSEKTSSASGNNESSLKNDDKISPNNDAMAKERMDPSARREDSSSASDTRHSSQDNESPAGEQSVSSGETLESSSLITEGIRKQMKAKASKLRKAYKEAAQQAIEGIDADEIKGMLEQEKRVMAAQELSKQRKESAQDIHPGVPSPYFGNVDYRTEVISSSGAAKKSLSILQMDTDLRRYSASLKSSFHKIFNQKCKQKEYKTNGKLDGARVAGRKITARIFAKTTKPENKSDLSVVMLIDESGSMRNYEYRVRQTVVMLLEAFRPYDVKVKLIGFTSISGDPVYRHYGDKGWKNTKELEEAATRMKTGGGTFLGHAIRYAGLLLKNRPEKGKIFICLTDGEPSANYYKTSQDGMNDCRAAVKNIERFADVIGIGLYSETDKRSQDMFQYIFAKNAVTMSNLEELIKVLPQKIKKIIE